MSVIIRQEINLVTGGSVVGTHDFKGIVQLDTTQYVNPTYYFEAVVSNGSGTGTVSLRRNGTTTDDATLSPTGSLSNVRQRSASFTPPSGKTEYFVHVVSSTNTGISAARIIIIDNPNALTSTETQIELGTNGSVDVGQSVTAISTAPATNTRPRYWLYTAANWDGTKTFYFEAVLNSQSTKVTASAQLQQDNGSFASWTAVGTDISTSAGVVTRVRSVAFTPVDGRHYRIVYYTSNSKSAIIAWNAKIIVDQVTTTTQQDNQILDSGNTALIQGASGGFESAGQSITPSTSFVLYRATFSMSKTGSPSDNLVATIATSLNGSAVATSNTVAASSVSATQGDITFIFPGGYNVTNGVQYFIRITRTGARDTSNYCFLYYKISGASYTGGALLTSSSGSWGTQTVGVCSRFSIDSTPGITLLEPQYLLADFAISATGLIHFQTLIDKTNEWSGVTIVGKHVMDSDNVSNSIKLQDIDNANADITSSAVTGSNQQISADIWANFTDGHQVDGNATNTTGVIAANRILTAVTVTPPSTSPVGRDIQNLQNTLGAVIQQALNRGGMF